MSQKIHRFGLQCTRKGRVRGIHAELYRQGVSEHAT